VAHLTFFVDFINKRTAHVDALPPNAGWDVVKDALARLREDNDRFEQYCLEQLDELEARRAELAEREKLLERDDSATDQELVQARTQLARLASVAVELADTRAELVETRKQLEEQRKLTAQAESRAAAIESQIDEVRHTAEAQSRRMSEERSEWVGELLRSALEIRSQLSTVNSADADLKVVHHEQEAAASAGRVDPVLSQVMAQFETLQKGRGSSAGGKPGRQGVA
jgi:DNA repair ATPase RecN